MDATFFSEQRSALEQLCGDWGFDKSKIEEKAGIHHWMEKKGYGARDVDA